MKNCRNLNENIFTNPIEIKQEKIIDQNSKIFTMGSCFAHEIYNYLKEKKFNVLTKQISENEPELIWYNTYTMRYEFERLTGEFTQGEDDFWQTSRGFQDPYRRFLFSETKEGLLQKIEYLNDIIKKGILNADVFIMTLGLTEVFFQNKNNNAICATPGYGSGGGHDSCVKFTSFQENYNNISKIMEIINKLNPKCQVILTVSPVPLGLTYSDTYDHIIANTESKSILRAVAAEITKKYNFCHYFYSYELANSIARNDVYIDDARHVKREFVSYIMQQFELNFIKRINNEVLFL